MKKGELLNESKENRKNICYNWGSLLLLCYIIFICQANKNGMGISKEEEEDENTITGKIIEVRDDFDSFNYTREMMNEGLMEAE